MSSIYSGSAVYHSSITIPSDGDARAAASVNIPIEALADDVAFLAARVGGAAQGGAPYRLAALVNFQATGGTIGSAITGTSDAVITTLGAIAGCLANDIVKVRFAGSMFITGNTSIPVIATWTLYASQGGGAFAAIPAALVSGSCAVSGVDQYVGAPIEASLLVTVPGNLVLQLQGHLSVGAGGTDTSALKGGYSANVEVWRPA